MIEIAAGVLALFVVFVGLCVLGSD